MTSDLNFIWGLLTGVGLVVVCILLVGLYSDTSDISR